MSKYDLHVFMPVKGKDPVHKRQRVVPAIAVVIYLIK